MKLDEAVVRDPEIMSGALCFRGTRVLVSSLFDFLTGGDDLEDFFKNFPTVTPEQVSTVLAGSYELLESQQTIKRSA